MYSDNKLKSKWPKLNRKVSAKENTANQVVQGLMATFNNTMLMGGTSTSGFNCVKKIVTDMAVLDVLPEGGFLLIERAPGVSVEEIKEATEGHLIIPDHVPEMNID